MKDPMLKPNTNFCKCGACGEYFGGVKGFDYHRVGVGGDRSCIDPSAVANRQGRRLLRLNDKGYWVGTYQ